MAPMSSSSSGSFSLMTTAAVVCFEKTETQPCDTPERRNTSATWSVTSRNSRAAWVRKGSVSAQNVRPPTRRTRAPDWSSESSSRWKAGFVTCPIPAQLLAFGTRVPNTFASPCCARNLTRAVTDESPGGLVPGGAHLVEAIAAIHRPAHGGRERDLGWLAALGANHLVELLGATGAPDVAVDRPAVETAGRLVLESLGRVELLLTDGEDEIETTVT